jgi:cobalt/nickel transport system permease protein
MSNIRKSFNRITSLEELAIRNTPIHRMHPAIKLLATAIYLVMVISFGGNQISGLIVFFLYPFLLMAFGEIPFKPLLGRLVIALPFTVFAGLSNILVSREAVMILGGVVITQGMLTFVSILMKTILTVSAVLILIATTSMNDLLYAMMYFHIPSILVMQITMTFRYLSVLMGEVSVMYHAYMLRAPREKGIKLKDMGPFLGQLIIRSFDRAERIYHAMKCRGFEDGFHFSKCSRVPRMEWLYLAIVIVLLIVLRFVNVSRLIGELIIA